MYTRAPTSNEVTETFHPTNTEMTIEERNQPSLAVLIRTSSQNCCELQNASGADSEVDGCDKGNEVAMLLIMIVKMEASSQR